MAPDDKKQSKDAVESVGGQGETNTRRDALKKMAVYSAYATPALLALMHSKKAQAFSIEV